MSSLLISKQFMLRMQISPIQSAELYLLDCWVMMQFISKDQEEPRQVSQALIKKMGSALERIGLPDIKEFTTKEWKTEPGDVVAFNFKTIHGANANIANTISRTLSFRLLGDDAVYKQRPGRTSPSFPGINQKNGERLREDWFPTLVSK